MGMKKAQRRVLIRGLAVTFGLLLGVCFMELALRLILSLQETRSLTELTLDVPDDPDIEHPMGEYIYPVPNDNLIYRFKPNARGKMFGQTLEINSLGLHDEELLPSGENAFRILVLGDSISFGWKIEREDSWPEVLERYLNMLDTDRPVEVINAAVPGYNSVMELEVFHQQVEVLEPDMVIIQYCYNDGILPNFITRHQYQTGPLGLIVTSRRAWAKIHTIIKTPVRLEMSTVPMIATAEKTLEMNKRDVPKRYHHHLGHDKVEQAYRELRDECKARGIGLLCILHADSAYEDQNWGRDPHNDTMRGILGKLGIETVYAYDGLRWMVDELRLESRDVEVEPGIDGHPNKMGQMLMAKALLPRVISRFPGAISQEKISRIMGVLLEEIRGEAQLLRTIKTTADIKSDNE